MSLRAQNSQVASLAKMMVTAIPTTTTMTKEQEAGMPEDLRIPMNNNNNKGDGNESVCVNANEHDQDTRWSPNNTWTWDQSGEIERRSSSRTILCVLAGVIGVFLVITVIVGLLILYAPSSRTPPPVPLPSTTPDPLPFSEFKHSAIPLHRDDSSDNVKKIQQELYRRKVSKLSWDMLNRSDKKQEEKSASRSSSSPVINSNSDDGNDGDYLVLPADMVYTDGGSPKSPNGATGTGGSSNGKTKARSCCRTQKYTQVIKREGCEPLTIVNRMCFGQCVSVWVPGLFASFPVCKPSRSTWKTVTLTCGRKRDRRKKVKVEKVRRCSCMEMDPTPSSSSL